MEYNCPYLIFGKCCVIVKSLLISVKYIRYHNDVIILIYKYL